MLFLHIIDYFQFQYNTIILSYVSLTLLSSVWCAPRFNWTATSCYRGICTTQYCCDGVCGERRVIYRTEERRDTDDVAVSGNFDSSSRRTETTPRYSRYPTTSTRGIPNVSDNSGGRTEPTPRYSTSTKSNIGRNQNPVYETTQSAETESNYLNGESGISREISNNDETRFNDAKDPFSGTQTIGTHVYL